MKSLLLVLLLDVQNVHVMPGECFMFQPLGKSASYTNDVKECGVATPPAGTFDIPHALIAQELGVVRNPMERVPWPRDQQPFETWRQDHSLDSAIRDSVEWFFEKSATLIGAERMKEQLAKLGYAADTIEGENMRTLPISGDLLVTPAEQLEFLVRMFRYELPVKESSVDVVKNAMQMPAGLITNPARNVEFELKWPAGTIVRARTGNTRLGKERVSWMVGHLETGRQQYVFVTRVRRFESTPFSASIIAAYKYLNALAPK